IDFGIFDVVAIDGELVEGSEVGCGKNLSHVTRAEQLSRRPVTEAESGFEERLLQLRNRERSQRQNRRQLQHFATGPGCELACLGAAASGHLPSLRTKAESVIRGRP